MNWRTDNTIAKRKKDKKTINDLQNTAQKTKDWVKWTQPKSMGWTRVLWKVEAVPTPLMTSAVHVKNPECTVYFLNGIFR